jgi:hypothetical protein
VRPGRGPACRRGGEGGQITIFVVIFTVAALLLGALVVDGGFVLAARRRVIVEADAAARAGADALAADAYRSSGEVVLDPAAAAAAARGFLAAAGHSGSVEVRGDRVVVVVRFRSPTALLGMIGIDGVEVSGRGEARAVRGVVGEE